MISVQKSRITNLSDLVSRLSSVEPIESKVKPALSMQQVQQQDKLIIEQLLKLNTDQYPVYLAQNPFPIKCISSSTENGSDRFNTILHSIPAAKAVEFASCAVSQIFRISNITELVQTLRKSIHNRQFLHRIESFACSLFNAGSCRLFTLQPQQNQMVSYIDNDAFTLQVPLGRGIVGNCAKDGKVMILQSGKDSEAYDPEIDDYFNIGDNPAMLVPIFDSSSNFVIGVLLVHTPKVGALFTPEDHIIGEILSNEISPFLTSYVEHIEKNDDRVNRTEITHAVNALLGKNTLEELLPTILSVIQSALNSNDAELYMYDTEQKMIYVFEPQIGPDGKQFFARKYFSGTTGIPIHVITTLQVVNITRLTPEKCDFFSRDTDLPALGQSIVAVPVFGIDKKPIAVLTAYGKRGANMFSSMDISSLQTIAVQVGVNITNILVSQSVLTAQQNSNISSGNFEKPLRALIQTLTSKNLSKKYQLCDAVAKELSKVINCDLIGIWDINANGKPEQQYILKSNNPIGSKAAIPPVVENAAKIKQVMQYSIASEVKQMIGSFDEDINYKSYSNLTFPVVNSEGECKWVIMTENSLSPQGRFTENDISNVGDYSLFLILFSEIANNLTQMEKDIRLNNVTESLYSVLSPVKTGIVERVLDDLGKQVKATDFALYKIDNVAEQLSLIAAKENSAAPKTAQLQQGLLGQVAAQGQTLITHNITQLDMYNPSIDSLGKNPTSAMFVKLEGDLVLEFISDQPDSFTNIDVEAVLASTKMINHAVEIIQGFNDILTSGTSGVSAEERASMMSRSSAPTRSDLEEFSDRLFNIMAYNEDDRMVMILKMFVSQGVIRKLQVPFQKLTHFICSLRSTYNVTPYHNWTHACDVLQFVYSCIIRGRLKQYLNDIEIFALLLAAISHDADHHGLNNAFHKKARTPLGILYEDRPVMEMHHCATSIRLLSMPEHDILEGIESYNEKCHFYEFFIKIILATDMDRHLQYIKEFEEVSKEFDKRNEKHRLLLAQIIMKCGDLSNTTRAFDTASAMAYNLTEEFFRQGDLEAKLGVEITPMCDRSKAQHISISQVGFYGFLASPLLTALGKFIPSLADNTEQLEKNKKMWEQQKLQYEASQQQQQN